MSIERGFDVATSPERQEKVRAIYVGRLEDLGLGNPDGIPSRLAEASAADLELYGERLVESLREVTDYEHDGCIDGRCTLENADGSAPQVRERHVSGSASNTEIAMNADASVIDTVPADADLKTVVNIVDDHVQATTSKARAAHTGACGGANGAIKHNELINSEPAVLKATEALLTIPEVERFVETAYDEPLGRKVAKNAAQTALWLEANGWDGQTYVDRTVQENPRGVETLETKDDPFHGHAEDALVVDLVRGKSVTMNDVFVVDMSAIQAKAHGFEGQRGHEGYTQAVIADVAKHMAVAKVLPSTKTPVYILA